MLRSVAFGLLFFASPSLAATDTLLDFAGAIPGEATIEGYSGWIPLTSLGMEGFAPSSVDAPGARTTRPARFTSITVTKDIDSSSGALFGRLLSGDPLPTATIDIVSVGFRPLQLFTLTLAEPIVTGFQIDDVAGADKPTETLTLSFSQVCVIAYDVDSGGNATPQAPVCYDVVNRSAL